MLTHSHFFKPGSLTKLIIMGAKKMTKEGTTLPEITYVARIGRDWDAVWVQLQGRGRFSGAQLVQFLLKKKPLNLQLGSHALRQSDLLPTLLHGMSLAEQVDPAQSQGGWMLFVWDLFHVSNTKDCTSQLNNTRDTDRQVHTDINKKGCANRFANASYWLMQSMRRLL